MANCIHFLIKSFQNRNMLIKTLGEKIETATNWFEKNKTIVNPNKFQAILVKGIHQMLDKYPLHIMNENINSEATVKLLGIGAYNK